MASNIVLTADTAQAVREINRLDAAHRKLGQSIADAGKQQESAEGGLFESTAAKAGAAAAAIGGAVAGVIAWAESAHLAAVEASTTLDQVSGVDFGQFNSIYKAVDGIIDVNSILHAQNVLMQGDMKLSEYQMSVLAKTAASWADQTGAAEGEVLVKLSNAIATGSKLEKLLAQHGISVKLTGDKARDTAIVMDLLAKKFGDAAITAGNAGERLTQYNNEMKLIRAYAMGGEETIGEKIAHGWQKAKDSVGLFLSTGKTVSELRAEMEREFQTKSIVKSINEMTASLKDYADAYDRVRKGQAELQSGSAGYGTQEQAALQSSQARTEYEWLQKFDDELPARQAAIGKSKESLRQELLRLVGDESMAAEGLDKLYEYATRLSEKGLLSGFDLTRFDAVQNGYREIMSAERAIIVESMKFKTERIKIVRDEAQRIQEEREKASAALTSLSQQVATAAVQMWGTANKLTAGLIGALGKDISKAFLTPLPKKGPIDAELKRLTEDAAKAQLQLQVAWHNGDLVAQEKAEQAVQRTQDILLAYKNQGKEGSDFWAAQWEYQLKKQDELAKKEKDRFDELLKNIGQEFVLEDQRLAKQEELYQHKTKGLELLGKEKIETDELTRKLEELAFQKARTTDPSTILEMQEEIDRLQKRKLALIENVTWQRDLKRAMEEQAALLPYLSQGSDFVGAADLKQKELELSVALLKNDKERADVLKGQIADMKVQANNYGELQAKMASWGSAWELQKKLTESVFRSGTEALLMSNAELKKAGKSRSQMVMEALKSTLKAYAIENAIKGGTRLAEALAATAIGNPSAAGLYAAAAKHFAVAAAAGYASTLIKVSSGGGGAKKESTAAASTSTSTSTTVVTNYNLSNSMMLENPDALVRTYRGMEASYTDRKGS